MSKRSARRCREASSASKRTSRPDGGTSDTAMKRLNSGCIFSVISTSLASFGRKVNIERDAPRYDLICGLRLKRCIGAPHIVRKCHGARICRLGTIDVPGKRLRQLVPFLGQTFVIGLHPTIEGRGKRLDLLSNRQVANPHFTERLVHIVKQNVEKLLPRLLAWRARLPEPPYQEIGVER